MSRRFVVVGLCLFAVIALTAGTAGPASAQGGKKKKAVVRPLKGPGVATWDNVFLALADTASFEGTGLITGLGRVEQSGTLELDPASAVGDLIPGSGRVTITAANGRDSFTFDYSGILNAANGVGQGTFTLLPDLGTGRFKGATGGGTFQAVIDLSAATAQPMAVRLDGIIKY